MKKAGIFKNAGGREGRVVGKERKRNRSQMKKYVWDLHVSISAQGLQVIIVCSLCIFPTIIKNVQSKTWYSGTYFHLCWCERGKFLPGQKYFSWNLLCIWYLGPGYVCRKKQVLYMEQGGLWLAQFNFQSILFYKTALESLTSSWKEEDDGHLDT